MAANKGFPSNPSLLTSAVRKALFTSAAVTAIAVGAPGHNAYAQQVGTCNPISTEFTSGTVQCSGEFDATIEYQVQDFTVVGGEVAPGDIKVVVAEGSVATGIEISSIVPATGEIVAQGSVTIENHGDLTQAAGAALEVPEENIIHFGDDYGLRKSGTQGNYSGYTYTGSVQLDSDGNPVGDAATFAEGVAPGDMASYLGLDQSVLTGPLQDNGGPIEDLSIVIADQGELDFDDIAAISAETDAGTIDIANTGDISMGSGLKVEYHTHYSISSGGVNPIDVDTDGDGVDDLRLYADRNQVFLPNQSRGGTQYRFETSASVIGIDAASATGDINISNAGSIDAGDVAYGVRSHTDSGDIGISNTGDIALGADSVGISATTAANAELVYQYGYSVDNGVSYRPTSGAPGTSKYKAPAYFHSSTEYVGKIFNADGGDSRIQIANAGTITVGAAGTGILAHNPSGDEIIIDNSGDITVGAGEGGAGIDASAMAGFSTQYTVEYAQTPGCGGFFGPPCEPLPYETNVVPGDGVEAGDAWYATDLDGDGIETPTKHYYNQTVKEGRGYVEDLGDITIVNSGTIDITAATGATAINAATMGATAIENSGSILVGADSTGIRTSGVGETQVINSGDIQLVGDSSRGMRISSYVYHILFGNDSIGNEEIYGGFDREVLNDTYAGFGGDTNVLNSGSITGTMDKADVLVYNEAGDLETINPYLVTSVGISVSTTNSNLKGTDLPFAAYGPESLAAWEERTGTELSYRDSIEFFETNVVNTGDIAMGDLSTGIRLSATYGEATIINSGSVSVGDGVLGERFDTYNPVRVHSVAIAADPGGDSWANNTVINTADGVVSAGELGKGLIAASVGGDAMVINDGTVTVGSGAVIEASDHRETAFTINSAGLQSSTVLGIDSYAMVANNGTVTTGDNSAGIQATNATGPGFFTNAFEGQATAVAVNTGQISSGDHSFGLAVGGASSLGYNSGDITIGSGDFYSTNYSMGSAAMASAGGLQMNRYSTLVNAGTITTGDDTAGIFAQGFYMAAAVQLEGGEIVTGDDTFGMHAIGYVQAATQNAGSITTGDNSFGMRTYAIYASAVNSGDITVGDNAIGVQVTGASAYAVNTGNITTGDNSTAMSVFSGGSPAFVVNTGTITTGANGVALDVRGQHFEDLETGEVAPNQILNYGNITGSIITGDGADYLKNGVAVNQYGLVTSAGRITLNDAVIDMGDGVNTFVNEVGDILFSGDSVIDLGAQGQMINLSSGANYITFNGVNGVVGDTLTINGDVVFNGRYDNSGELIVDVAGGSSDRIVINGDMVAQEVFNSGETRSLSVRLGMVVTEQAQGEITTGPVLQVNGDVEADAVQFAGFGGQFADTILSAELQQDGGGNWVIAYTAGLSNLGAAASSVSHLAENMWMKSASVQFDEQRGASSSELGRQQGLRAWSTMFHSDSDVEVSGAVASQALGFTQQLGGQMAGATYTTRIGDHWVSVSPMVGLGTADGNQVDQQSGALLDTKSYGISGNWNLGAFYASAMYQVMDFDANIQAYDSVAATSGQAHGFSLTGGWRHQLESGLSLTSFAQWDDVKMEMDAFASSDGAYNYATDLGNSKRARLGVSLSKSFSMPEGYAMPYVTFSVADRVTNDTHDLHSNGVAFTSDVSGNGFNIDFGVDGRYRVWDIKGGLGVHSGEVDKNGLSAKFSVSRSL
ncbi:hypothetical protein [uncultured Microbulbifer sp.]|uniref:hypothetical protein n=1 Tax=uncultured Microbulbifer sp. TaxID=348147 RepID=UPI0026122062|nr:hypothetical protein [uncultured Microbulbifer sp.]